MSFRIGIDMGGTFTDAYMVDEDGGAYVAKAPTDRPTCCRHTAAALEGLAVNWLGSDAGAAAAGLALRVRHDP